MSSTRLHTVLIVALTWLMLGSEWCWSLLARLESHSQRLGLLQMSDGNVRGLSLFIPSSATDFFSCSLSLRSALVKLSKKHPNPMTLCKNCDGDAPAVRAKPANIVYLLRGKSKLHSAERVYSMLIEVLGRDGQLRSNMKYVLYVIHHFID